MHARFCSVESLASKLTESSSEEEKTRGCAGFRHRRLIHFRSKPWTGCTTRSPSSYTPLSFEYTAPNFPTPVMTTTPSSPNPGRLIPSKDGTLIYADAVGDPSKPCAVFLHGTALSAAVFNDLFADSDLLKNLYLVRYDLRGHGRSGKPETEAGYRSELFAQDFDAVASAFGVRKPVLVGWWESWKYGLPMLFSLVFQTLMALMSGTVACDISAHLPSDTLAGVVYLAGLPFIGPIMGRIGTPTIAGFRPGLVTTDDVDLSTSTTVGFVNSLFVNPDAVPFELKCAWMGTAVLQSPRVRKFVLSRAQDPTKLFELGSHGLPLLIMSGTCDSQIKGDVLAEEMKQHFKNVDVNMIEGGNHALFYDYPEEVVRSIISFVLKANGK
ncbi:hypothetical protein EW146_g5487 [Bondarzewia mesenterica]|uniref:AB hydrolase-1 domain-containing protein n=1 Tax=Bondarzewia mesenterica TaxID=1095465 RepID=A0A4S4LTG3_9AGAM|nr:hypothetical protein EW146_g5487 [Bondarzewia mesenterica]